MSPAQSIREWTMHGSRVSWVCLCTQAHDISELEHERLEVWKIRCFNVVHLGEELDEFSNGDFKFVWIKYHFGGWGS